MLQNARNNSIEKKSTIIFYVKHDSFSKVADKKKPNNLY